MKPVMKSWSGTNTEKKQAFDYTPTIDYDDLDRNMPLIQAGKMRSIFQCQASTPLISHQLDSLEREIPKEKSNISWDIHSRPIPTKRPVPVYASTQTDRDTFRRHPSTPSEDFQAMLPQLIDCRSLWRAAQASALGIPVYPSSYTNFRLARGSETYSITSADDESQRPGDCSRIASNETYPYRQFTVTASTALSQSQSNSIVVPESRFNTNQNNENCRTHVIYNSGIPTARSLNPSSFDAIDVETQDSPINLSQSGINSTTNRRMENLPKCKSTLRNPTLGSPAGARDLTNSKFSCFTKPTRLNEESQSQEISHPRSGGYIDYHKRKRKLLRGAQDPEAISTNWSKDGHAEEQARCAKSRKQHCSSEDGILTKTYNKHQLETGSDSDSDDSGRPCSV